ncbi:AAA family ATPase [Extibacter muris]|uniref:ATP-binding protein n=1 Tax=Extibacter muris TaxID=1796622 RepID=A0A4R4F8K2_9FIRM|nr:ATP-binding protein [Extibacter muris]MCU0081390.1 ATP-binding protein [Extibacter muris]TDA20104.1 ATP-binding protein [Extibacter muris]
MLLEFKTKNYKSFVEESSFSMVAAPKQKGLDYSLMKTKVKGKEIRGLSSSVIYGPNAAGKTNIIGAMDVLRAIVLRGNIRNTEEKSSPNPAATALELIPNNKEAEGKPVYFSVEFYEEAESDKFRILYELEIDLGVFLDEEYPRKIVTENLFVNGEPIFQRADNLHIGNMKVIREYLSDVTEQNVDSINEIAKNSLNKEELFLTNGFKLIFSQKFVKLILDWFTNKFMVIYRADSMQLIKRFADPKKKAVYVEKTTDKAAKLFGINSNAVGYVISEDEPEAKLYSIFKDMKNKKNTAIAAEIFESYGTIRFINMFPLVIKAIQTGGTLIVDEFDASIHPMALMSIINVFHNDDINIHHAQLIFNTHNPIFLNSNLFRRDEIKFVERDDDSHQSILYALSDFGTTGDKGVRKHEDYMGKYFISQYGAIKDIDFTPIFEEILDREGEV